MSASTTSFRLLGSLVLVVLSFFGVMPSEKASGVPAPISTIYALLYVPKKADQFETTRNRRRQIASVKTRSTLYEAIRSLKGVALPALPKKGKDQGVEDRHDDDVAWLEQHLQIEYLEGTGVLRIALTGGKPREQAILVNAVVHAYFQLEVRPQQEIIEKTLDILEDQLNSLEQVSAVSNNDDKKILEREIVAVMDGIKRNKEGLRTLPRLLELADVPSE